MSAPIKDPQAQLAKLFIPSEVTDGEAVRWRLQLISRNEIFDAEKLIKLLKKISKSSISKITEAERSGLIDQALDEKNQLDEYDVTVLFVTNCLSSADTMTDKSLPLFDKFSRVQMDVEKITFDQLLKRNPEYFKSTRANLKSYSETLLKHEIPKMRAKLALKELATLFQPDIMIPHMVGISSVYLASPLTQKWIRAKQYLSKFGDEVQKQMARQSLRHLSKSVEGDHRKLKKRELPYWKLGLIFEDLSLSISGFRSWKKEKKFDVEYFKAFCRMWQIGETLSDIIVSGKEPPRELALSIMIERGDIKSAKSFREIQPFLTKLQKKHFGGKILGIAGDLVPVIVDFLDVPATHPEIIAKFNLMEVLERVRL